MAYLRKKWLGRDILYSIIVVVDDSKQREILKTMILSTHEAIKIYEADSKNTALNIIKKNFINIFLLDVNLKKSSGLDLAIDIRRIPKYEFSEIIFFADHLEYILQAFKQIHCYDYILKPYNKTEVQAILTKLISNKIHNLKNEDKDSNKKLDKELVIKIRNNIYVVVKIYEILFIEVTGRGCEINTLDRTYTYSNISLKKLLELIDCECIIQSHRSFAVNINYISKIEKLGAKLGTIYFKEHSKTALIGYKFKNNIVKEFKKISVNVI